MTTAKFDCRSLAGLYAVTPDLDDTDHLLQMVGAALCGGVVALQYRNKGANNTLRRSQAHALRALTRRFHVALIVNDDLGVATEALADGVHLGRDEVSALGGLGAALRECHRRGLGAGVSCYNDASLAAAAAIAGADYLAFGSVFPSPTKPLAARAELSLIAAAKRSYDIPIVAIGGITLDNARCVVDAGADAIAVVSGLFSETDVAARARAFQRLFVDSVSRNPVAC